MQRRLLQIFNPGVHFSRFYPTTYHYAGSNLPEHKQEALEHGGQGSTNNAQDLFEIVMKAIVTHK